MASNLKEAAPNHIDSNDVYQAKDIIAFAQEAAQVLDRCDAEEVRKAVMIFQDGWARLRAKLCNEEPTVAHYFVCTRAKRNKLTHDKQQQFHC